MLGKECAYTLRRITYAEDTANRGESIIQACWETAIRLLDNPETNFGPLADELVPLFWIRS